MCCRRLSGSNLPELKFMFLLFIILNVLTKSKTALKHKSSKTIQDTTS